MPIYMPPEIEKLYKETLEESKAEGKAEGITYAIANLVKKGLLSVKEAAKELNISENDIQKLLVN